MFLQPDDYQIVATTLFYIFLYQNKNGKIEQFSLSEISVLHRDQKRKAFNYPLISDLQTDNQ